MSRRFYKRTSKYEDEAVLLHSVVTEVLEKNAEYPNDRIKNVFRVKSKNPEGRLCVLWGRSCVEVGCEIQAKGRIVNNGDKEVFLCWSALIMKRGPNEQ